MKVIDKKKYKKYIERTCIKCGKVDVLLRSGNRKPSDFCRSCGNIGAKNPNWKNGLTVTNWMGPTRRYRPREKTYTNPVIKECPKCKSFFTTLKSYKVFCSEKCNTKFRNDLFYNKNKINWVKYKSDRRAREKNATGIFILEDFYAIIRALNNYCPCCGKMVETAKFSIDHIIPLSKGGSNDMTNIQPLCLNCNIKKGVKTTNYIKDKLFSSIPSARKKGEKSWEE